MARIEKIATLEIQEDASDIQIKTEVKAVLYWNTATPSAKSTSWECTATGDIGRGINAEEWREWFFNAETDQKGHLNFVISDGGPASVVQFQIDVSTALQERKITMSGDFPFHLNMRGKGVVTSFGGVITNGTKIEYKVVGVNSKTITIK